MSLQFPAAADATQRDWRFCVRCLSLFWNGRPDNGWCPAPNPSGGPHVAVSWDFYLAADPQANISQQIGQVHHP